MLATIEITREKPSNHTNGKKVLSYTSEKSELCVNKAQDSKNDYETNNIQKTEFCVRTNEGVESLISVLVPVYNVENYVETAIDSLLCQTYSNLEIIVVDDCSTDKTFEILKKLAEKDARIKLFKNEKNSKICQTLNHCLLHAKGNYIARMDGDDISHRERLEKLKKYLDEHPDIDLVGSQSIAINENGKELSRKKLLRTPNFIRFGNRFMCSVQHIWLCRRNVYDVLNGYREIPYSEDYDFLLRGENQGFKYANIEDYAYLVRTRAGNTATTNGLAQRKTARYVQKIHRREKIGKKGYDPQEHQASVSCREQESECYRKANELLATALDRSNPVLRRIIYTLRAAVYSKYMFRYLTVAAISRVLIKIEDISYPRRLPEND